MTAYEIAKGKLGMKEIPGVDHNPEIIAMFAKVGHSWVKDDETAWCAAFAGWAMELAGVKSTGKLNAKSYMTWGNPVDPAEAQEGDIVVFSRGNPSGWQGHVGFYVGRKGDKILVLGGNQSNAVTIAEYPASRLLAVRRHANAPKVSSTTIAVGTGTTFLGLLADYVGLPPAGVVAVALAGAVVLWFVIKKFRK